MVPSVFGVGLAEWGWRGGAGGVGLAEWGRRSGAGAAGLARPAKREPAWPGNRRCLAKLNGPSGRPAGVAGVRAGPSELFCWC
jgi:hypothetical protein